MNRLHTFLCSVRDLKDRLKGRLLRIHLSRNSTFKYYFYTQPLASSWAMQSIHLQSSLYSIRKEKNRFLSFANVDPRFRGNGAHDVVRLPLLDPRIRSSVYYPPHCRNTTPVLYSLVQCTGFNKPVMELLFQQNLPWPELL
jgi:hypothetical protein